MPHCPLCVILTAYVTIDGTYFKAMQKQRNTGKDNWTPFLFAIRSHPSLFFSAESLIP
jgi:hypothetical protein